MVDSLGSRQKNYEEVSDFYLMNRVPVIIRVDGDGFSRLTGKLPKPSSAFEHVMANTMLYMCKEMQGVVFAFTHSDEITFVLRNDQSLDNTPWLQNRLCKILSKSASLATKGFDRSLQTLEQPLELIGDALFKVQAFTVPYLSEAVNNLIWRQQEAQREAIGLATQYSLGEKMGTEAAFELLQGKSSEERKKLLLEKCGINFDDQYPASFRKGIAAYRVPTLVKDGVQRNKWTLNFDLSYFVENQDFIYNILFNGHDIFRSPPSL